MKEDKKKERGEVSRRDFLVGAGAVVVGGAIGAAITYPLVKGDGGEVTTVTSVKTVPTTVVSTVGGAGQTVTTTVGGGATVTVPGGTKTVTTTVGNGGAVPPYLEPEITVTRTAALGGGGGHP